MTRMLNSANIFQKVIDQLNNGSFLTEMDNTQHQRVLQKYEPPDYPESPYLQAFFDWITRGSNPGHLD